MADVVLIPRGKTIDGKPLHEVVQVAKVPDEVTGKKGEKKNTSDVIIDKFGIERPKRSRLSTMYESMEFGHGRER
ncbi:MAG: hypothetical protein ACD_19C00429G0062 [uncultured bacterium]|nr:MAG: hypothetical protein ACD_19C00429G0062 [uncultured bacterium]